MRKRLIIVALLVAIAAIAGIVRSNSGASLTSLERLVSHNNNGQAREEKRETYELSPGARVEVSNINGPVEIETSETNTAEIYIERTASTPESLDRRRIAIEYSPTSLRIYGNNANTGFWSRLFASNNSSERVTLKVPRRISLVTRGVNGSVAAAEVEGALEVRGVNGRVDIASANGDAVLKGINGNVVLALKGLNADAVNMSGINGNIELRLSDQVNGYLDVKGINGRLVSDAAQISIEKGKRGRYWAQIGHGGNSMTAKGINGNIRLSRTSVPVVTQTATNASATAK